MKNINILNIKFIKTRIIQNKKIRQDFASLIMNFDTFVMNDFKGVIH